MVIGTTLIANVAPYYSPAFGRGGNSAIFAIEVLQGGVTFLFDVDVEHKNADDTTWTTLGSFAQWNAPGEKTKSLSGIKEMLRFEYTVGGTATDDYAHFFVYAPTWQE